MTRRRLNSLLLHIVLIIVALIILGPVAYTFMTSLKLFRDIISASGDFRRRYAITSSYS
jgi:ABC-type glycerol-3-phosphate transport system permease component